MDTWGTGQGNIGLECLFTWSGVVVENNKNLDHKFTCGSIELFFTLNPLIAQIPIPSLLGNIGMEQGNI